MGTLTRPGKEFERLARKAIEIDPYDADQQSNIDLADRLQDHRILKIAQSRIASA